MEPADPARDTVDSGNLRRNGLERWTCRCSTGSAWSTPHGCKASAQTFVMQRLWAQRADFLAPPAAGDSWRGLKDDAAREIVDSSEEKTFFTPRTLPIPPVMEEVRAKPRAGYRCAVEQIPAGELAIGVAVRTGPQAAPVRDPCSQRSLSEWTAQDLAPVSPPSPMEGGSALSARFDPNTGPAMTTQSSARPDRPRHPQNRPIGACPISQPKAWQTVFFATRFPTRRGNRLWTDQPVAQNAGWGFTGGGIRPRLPDAGTARRGVVSVSRGYGPGVDSAYGDERAGDLPPLLRRDQCRCGIWFWRQDAASAGIRKRLATSPRIGATEDVVRIRNPLP